MKPPDSQPKSEDRGRARAREARSSYGSWNLDDAARPAAGGAALAAEAPGSVARGADMLCLRPARPGGASAPLLVPATSASARNQ